MTPGGVGSRAGALGKDLVAGATVGLVSLPQAMAFALVAGVPPEVALYTMIVPGLMAGVLRDSPHLASGATKTGVGLAGLGRLSRYVSPAVVRGFTLGAAALLVIRQLSAALGIRLHASGRALVDLLQLAGRLPELEPRGLPRPALPALDPTLLRALLLPGLAIALVGMVEVVSVGKSIEAATGRKLRASVDCSGLGSVPGEDAIHDQAERPFAALETARQMARAHVGALAEGAVLRTVANDSAAWVI